MATSRRAQTAKKIVGTPLDEYTVQRLDAFCARVKRNRAEVLRGLAHSLLVEGKQNIFTEWREILAPSQAAIESTAKAKVLCALKRMAPHGTRAGSLVRMLSEEMSRASVYRTLDELCKSGEVVKDPGYELASGIRHPYYRVSLTG